MRGECPRTQREWSCRARETSPEVGVGTGPAGAYGLQFIGLSVDELVLLPSQHDWTRVKLEIAVAVRPPPAPESGGPQRTSFELLDGAWALVERETGRAVRGAPQPCDPTTLAHPFLAAVGVAHAEWAGRAALHAGAVLLGDHAWLVLGESWSGKSSTLAAFAAHGVPVVADDLAVVDEHAVFAGPRIIDLRPDVATHLQVATRPVRGGGRRRVALDSVAPESPVAGVVHLEWSAGSPRLDPLGPAERLRRLLPALWPIAPGRPDVLLSIAAKPGFALRRPRRLSSTADSVAAIEGLA